MEKLNFSQAIQHDGVSIPLRSLLHLRFAAQNIALTGERRVGTLLAGGQQSHFRGRGVDFAEVRSYQSGDDIRAMDWRVTARTGKPHTKLYQEERERPTYFVVDSRDAMHFGTQVAFKSVIAAQAAALLAWGARKHGDKVGGLVTTDEACIEFRALPGERGILPLLKYLAEYRAESNSQQQGKRDRLSETLIRLRRMAPAGSLVFIISDFSKLSKDAERHLYLLSQRHDLHGLFVYDPIEKEPPPANRYLVSDGHDFFNLDCGSKQLQQQYRDSFSNHFQRIESIARGSRMNLIQLATNEDIIRKLCWHYRKSGSRLNGADKHGG